MRKPLLLLLFTSLVFLNEIKASHIVGGEVFYEYLGPGSSAGTSRYKISLRLFRDCLVQCGVGNVACLPTTAIVSVFANSAGYPRPVNTPVNVVLGPTTSISANYPLCISTKPPSCYEVKTYTATVTLPDNDEGYILAYQNCCRAAAANVLNGENTLGGIPGATYDCVMPGKNKLTNSSAVFKVQNAEIVCYNSDFRLDFSAEDPDSTDSLSYAFSGAYNGGAFQNAQDGTPAGSPVYEEVNYDQSKDFSGESPLGPLATIDPKTGIISGISPGVGRYVVNVIVYEWRNGVVIGQHRKDFIMRVENCTIPQAGLEPSYITCDGFNLTFQNETTSPIINSYYWDFGVNGINSDTSDAPVAQYSFPDSGTYTITLITNKGQVCSDTAIAVAKVYPGFKADFNTSTVCYQTPIQFNDASATKYGKVDSWRWDFGDLSTTADTSILQNPSYKYPAPDSPTVSLIVTNSKGCTDTATKKIQILDKPAVNFPFKDTLICNIDTLQLIANTTASISWQPNSTNIILNPTSLTPLVFPKTDTWFVATFTENGCVGTDSVKVNVVDNVTINIGPDTSICLTDSVQFHPQTNALYFAWTPSATITDTTVKDAVATPVAATSTYHVTASVGKCNNSDDINVFAYPYPQAKAFGDTAICYGDHAQLSGVISGENFRWTPPLSLRNATTLSPVAYPLDTTSYILTAYNTAGCLKPVSDTVIVAVIPRILANAGRDTTIVFNQPLHLNATGGNTYSWSPTYGMDNPNIADPTVVLSAFYDTVYYKVRVSITPPGCFADDIIRVVVFKTKPDIFIPTAFTPNSDGRNDILKPTVVGMKQFNYFRVFNRWGQMVYATSIIGQGWNGIFAGQPQPSGTYVFMAQAVDYQGTVVNRKGTAVLIR